MLFNKSLQCFIDRMKDQKHFLNKITIKALYYRYFIKFAGSI
jgi:hypothetical protein